MPDQIMKWLVESEKAPTLIAALVGILLRYLMHPHLSVRTALFSVAAGLSAAYFGAPAIADWLDLGPKSFGVLGWLCGMLGADLVQGFGALAKNWGNDPKGFIELYTGRSNRSRSSREDRSSPHKGDNT